MTHLLDSWMRAMAMRILVRRKMIVRRMIASATDMIITEGEGEEKYEKMKPLHTIISHTHKPGSRHTCTLPINKHTLLHTQLLVFRPVCGYQHCYSILFIFLYSIGLQIHKYHKLIFKWAKKDVIERYEKSSEALDLGTVQCSVSL